MNNDKPKTSPAIYEPLVPVKAAWSIEHPECFAAIFFQEKGNQVSIIGSKSWQFSSLSECFADVREIMPWKQAATNIIPPESDGVWSNLFELAGIDSEYAPNLSNVATVTLTREMISAIIIDDAMRPWAEDLGNNSSLIDSLNEYGADEVTTGKETNETFSRISMHSWGRYLVRALELIAIWRYTHYEKTGRNPNARRLGLIPPTKRHNPNARRLGL